MGSPPVTDVAAALEMNRGLRALSSVNRAFRRATDETALLRDVCRILCEDAGFHGTWIAYPDDEARTVRAVAWAGAAAEDLDGHVADARITSTDEGRGRGPMGRAIRTGQTASASDLASDAAAAPSRGSEWWRRCRAEAAIPLKDGAGRVFGALGVFSTEPDAFNADVLRFLEELAADLAFGVGAMHARSERSDAERERASHLYYLEAMERVNRAIAGAIDLEQMTGDVLGVALSVLGCDRAFLTFPCDPGAPSWSVPIERCRPEWPGANAIGAVMTMDAEIAAQLQLLLDTDGPVMFGPGARYALPEAIARRWSFQSLLSMAVRPRIGKPWQFGVHQCSHPRVWTPDEQRLLEAIGRRLGDALSTLLLVRDLRESEGALRRSEERYRRIVETAHEGIWLLDRDGRTTFVNRQMAQIVGYAPEEMLGKPVAAFTGEDQEPRSTQDGERRRHGVGERQELRLRRKDGASVWAALETTPISDDRGASAGVLAMVTDVTERRAMEVQLRQSQKLEAVGRLAGGVAHDFNNLLTAILGNATVLAEQLAPEHPLRTEAVEIEATARRAALLTRQLLAFGRKQSTEPRVVDVAEVLAAMDRMLRRLIGEDVELTTSGASDLGSVEIDPVQLEQVILNLAVNARDAMPSGGDLAIEAANVELLEADQGPRLDPGPGRYVRLTVRDTGTGMPPAVQAHLFEPFFTTKEQGKGTGLGLATVYGIVKQAGGDIRVWSQAGKGTSFDVYLPRVDAVPEPLPAAPARPAPRGAETVLVVEDEPMVRALTVRTLRGAGYEVVEASDAEHAVELVGRAGAPGLDLLITDVVMPRVSGPELADRLRQRRPDLPVLFASGYFDRVSDLQVRLGLRTGFIPKPFTPAELAHRVRELLDRAAQDSESLQA